VTVRCNRSELPVQLLLNISDRLRDLLIDIDLTRKQRGLETAVREAIRAGRLQPGDALPSTRGLAADLGVARSTVVAAYDQLIAEGYLVSRPGALTRVADGQWAPQRPGVSSTRPDFRLDLIPGEPDASRFPRSAWLRSTRAVMASAPDDLFGYGDPAGLGELRTELARYLNRTRNTVATTESIIIVAGVASGIAQIARFVHRVGARAVAVEEPGFPFHQAILEREGLQLVPVPVDSEGIDVEALAATRVAAVLVTPAHQYPLGAVMSPERRTGLAKWARQNQAWIIEDDYDGEYRYDRQPLGALQGIAPDRVIYLGSTSKTLGAGLRVGWIVVPAEMLGPLTKQRGRDNEVNRLTQATLARFIDQGDLDRHVRRVRSLYRTRRDQLLDAIGSVIDQPDIRGVSAGLHLTVALPQSLDETSVVQRALDEHHLALWGLRQHYLTDTAIDGLVLGFSRPATNFQDITARLASILGRSNRC
jgi:GntR family transcriptional regulator/MocR family aminotransferase